MGIFHFGPAQLLGLMVGGKDVTSFLYRMPLPLLIGLAVAALIGIFGIIGRLKAILSGKGSATDFLTVILVLMVATVILFLVAGRAIKEINVM